MSPRFLGLGNPLLDYSNEFDTDFAAEYKCAAGAAVLYDEATHRDLYERLRALPTTALLPGGATQNTMRAIAALCDAEGEVGFLGSVGDDGDADRMQDIASKAGLLTWYQRHPTEPTGLCAVVVDKETRDRSMVTRLGAACCFDIAHLEAHWDKVEQAEIIYSAGFFASACAEGMMRCAKHCAETGKFWAVCLCAEYVVQVYKDQVAEWVKYANLVIGNEVEWACYAKTFGVAHLSQEEVLKSVVSAPGWQGKVGKPRIAIMTRGEDDTLLAFVDKDAQNGPTVRVEGYPVPKIFKELIEDTNGCGDTFVGGFLFAWSRKLPVERCVEVAHMCAQEVLQNEGVVFDLEAIGKAVREIDLA